jgi:hypothetical protein
MFSQQVLDDDILVTQLGSLTRQNFISADLGSGPEPFMPDALIIEQATGTPASLLYTTASPLAVMRLNLASGARSVVADAGTGSGPGLDGVTDLVLDTRPAAGTGKALVLVGSPNFQLLSLDLVTGNRVQIADLNAVGPAVADPRHLQLDAANNRVLFSDRDEGGNGDALYAVHLGTGVRTTITSAGVGSGPAVGDFGSFTFDRSTTPARLLLADTLAQAILEVNLANGTRSIVADTTNGGSTLQFNSPGLLYHDAANARLIATNGGSPANLFTLALPSITQRLVSGADLMTWAVSGAGPQFFAPGGMAVDAAGGVVYVTDLPGSSLIAIDLVSGDRVIIAN